MPLYERVDAHGAVVERVQTIEGSTHDTILGVHALDGAGGWRLAGAVAPDPATAVEPETATASTEQPATSDDTDPGPQTPTRAPRAAAKPKKE
jgi:hypothetical protein